MTDSDARNPDTRPLWERISAAVEAAGYAPSSEQSMAELGRKLADAAPWDVTPTSARRNVYRWISRDDPSFPGPRWTPILEKVLGVPEGEFNITHPSRAQRSQFQVILEALDEIRGLVDAIHATSTQPGVLAVEPILTLLAEDPAALPPPVLREVADAMRRAAAEHLQSADRLDELAARHDDGRARRGA